MSPFTMSLHFPLGMTEKHWHNLVGDSREWHKSSNLFPIGVTEKRNGEARSEEGGGEIFQDWKTAWVLRWKVHQEKAGGRKISVQHSEAKEHQEHREKSLRLSEVRRRMPFRGEPSRLRADVLLSQQVWGHGNIFVTWENSVLSQSIKSAKIRHFHHYKDLDREPTMHSL